MKHRVIAPVPLWLAIVVCASGVATFSVMDVLMKQASIAVGPYSALVWRSIVATVINGAMMLGTNARWPAFNVLRLHILRGVLIAIMAWLFFWALVRMPLAEGIALSFIAPIIGLYLAALVLGERVRRTAIFAALMGLAGVIIIMSGRLSGSYDQQALLGGAAVLLSASLYAFTLVLQRRQAQVAGPVEVSFFQNFIVLLALLPAAPFLLQTAPSAHWPVIGAAAVLAIVSQLFLSWAYARAEAQKLIPLEYSAFLWAALLGWWVFGERLTIPTLIGTVMIVAGCLIAAREKPEMATHVEGDTA
jgi:S-adenosylmethionine uptake transporter